jgi:tetratricopeptide (TPR) repeat protein
MKFSENKNYLEYINQYSYENYTPARQAISRCMEDLIAERIDPDQLSYLLQITGNLYFLEGKPQDALEQYELSELAAPVSPLTKYFFATFLYEKAKNYDLAIKKCNEMIILVTSSLFVTTENDYSAQDYLKMASDLKTSILNSD